MRAVADTNTLVSALLWGGAPAKVLTARISQVGSTVAEMIAGYRALAQLARTTAIAPVSRDPDHDQVLACALAAGAGLIVTRDQDLPTLDPFRTIRILSAREALALLAEPRG